MPKWFWKLPFVWRFKYDYYHEQFIPAPPPKEPKTLPYVKYEVHDSGDIIWNPYDTPHFRCPHCGQAHELRFTYDAEDLRLKQNAMLDKVWLERYENRVLTDTYESDTQEFRNYVSRMWNEMDVPCHSCRETAPKWRWAHAYQNPLLYFETEHVCHCGGEMYLEPDPLGNHYLRCEDCGWVKPGSAVSGAERTDE
ncbi:hypothetical protein D3C76_878240 [compost metagenome]